MRRCATDSYPCSLAVAMTKKVKRRHNICHTYLKAVETELPLYMAIPVGGIFLFFRHKELQCCMTKGYQVSNGRYFLHEKFNISWQRHSRPLNLWLNEVGEAHLLHIQNFLIPFSSMQWGHIQFLFFLTSSISAKAVQSSASRPIKIHQEQWHFLTTLSMIQTAQVQPWHLLTTLSEFTYLRRT